MLLSLYCWMPCSTFLWNKLQNFSRGLLQLARRQLRKSECETTREIRRKLQRTERVDSRRRCNAEYAEKLTAYRYWSKYRMTRPLTRGIYRERVFGKRADGHLNLYTHPALAKVRLAVLTLYTRTHSLYSGLLLSREQNSPAYTHFAFSLTNSSS